LIQEIFGKRKLSADYKPPLPIGTPVSSRLSDQLAPTRQHQPTHAPILSNRGKPFNHSRKSLSQQLHSKLLYVFVQCFEKGL